jgi:hypothetical protein
MSTLTAGNVTVSCSLSADTSGNLVFQSGGNVTAMTIDSSQNVGIGTSSPTVYGSYRTLEVRGTGGGLLQIGTGATTAAYLYQDGTNSGFTNLANGAMTFGTNNTERARITSGGDLLLATTTAVDANAFMSIRNVNGTKTGMGIGNSTGTSDTNCITFFNSNGQIGRINTNGGATGYLSSSDYRLKEDVQPMTGALAKVAALKPVTYKWKADGSDGEGFIAHELAEVCPQAVSGEKDAVDEEGNIKPQGIDTSFLVATLTAAIQEQQQMIEELKAKVAALEAV